MRRFMSGRFSLHDDHASQDEIYDRIESGVIIRGTNLWVLIFATIVASIGLNVNSTAVIIGAMLISPLMGPIMGMGFSLGTNDFELLKRSAKNFGFMTVIAILTSTCYFAVSPWMAGEQSELLARTQPTTWDVFVAFFGGLAGIVAQTRREKSITVIPGVAIATALMPPLCTAGFGLASGQFNYFFGAFYLFIINTVFIGLAAFIITNSMKFEKKVFVDPVYGRRVKRLMVTIIIITIVPSIFIGYNLIREMIFKQNVARYITNTFVFDGANVLDYSVTYTNNRAEYQKIEVLMYGKPIQQQAIDVLRSQLENYDLFKTELIVRQGEDNTELTSSYITNNFEQLIKDKNSQINKLSARISDMEKMTTPSASLLKEMGAIVDGKISATISRSVMYDSNGSAIDTLLVCYIIQNNKKLTERDIVRLTDWLKARTNSKLVKVIEEVNPLAKIGEIEAVKKSRETQKQTQDSSIMMNTYINNSDSITIKDIK